MSEAIAAAAASEEDFMLGKQVEGLSRRSLGRMLDRNGQLLATILIVMAAIVDAMNGGLVAHAGDSAMHRAFARQSGILGVHLLLRSDQRGIRMLGTAAHNGDALAQYNLGVAFSRGVVTGRPEPVVALAWYAEAAEGGHASAAYNAGVLHANGDLGAPDRVAARSWMRRAAGMGHSGARRWLARDRNR